MDFNVTKRGSAAVVIANGRLDSNSSAAFEEKLIKVIDTEPAIVLDMSGFSYVSSAGLRVLLMAAKKCRATGRKLALSGLTANVHMVFDISGFLALFSIFHNVEDAVAAIA